MASSSSDESSKAPENFQVSSTTSNDEDDVCDGVGVVITAARNRVATGGAGVGAGAVGTCTDDVTGLLPTLKCPLCGTHTNHLHCRNCVKNGNIVHSGTHLRGESLTEKQQKYINLKSNLKVYANRFEHLNKEKKSCENVVFQIKRKKEQSTLLQQLIIRKRTKLQLLAEQRDKLHRGNEEKRKHLPNYPIKVKRLEDKVLDCIEEVGMQRERHQALQLKLQEVTRRGLQQLVDYIFPISEVVLRDELRQRTEAAAKHANAGDSETIAALADAKNTSYIRGKWVFHGSGISEMQYRIVAPSLPANGDYAAYLDWLSDNKNDVPKSAANEIVPSRVAAFRILGALTYTTQLTQLMSFYLNVRLPFKQAYGDFCKELNEEQFRRKVSRLNSNIMYLAYTQQVELRTLNENHTLENILAIMDLDKSDLGRHGYHEVSKAPLEKSIDSLLIGIETATESESEDENSQRLGWEAVPSLPTQPEIMNSNMPDATQQSFLHRVWHMIRNDN